MIRYSIFFALALFLPTSGVFAHGGGLDSSGCHHDRKNGGYHCHRDGYSPPPPLQQPSFQSARPLQSQNFVAVPRSPTNATTFAQVAPNLQSTSTIKSCLQSAVGKPERTLLCLSDELDLQKALFNVEYKILWREAGEESRVNLDKAQKAWVNFRNLECEAKSRAVAAADSPFVQTGCLIDQMVQRRKQLQNYFVQ
jgi:uncharacterized protein YecT (DUF1311 family)